MRCATDVGGTFTDFLFVEGDRVEALKLPSRPADPAVVVAEGIGGRALEVLLHGTTVATNAVLQCRTAPTALVTTQGFEDLLLIGRQNRPSLYDFRRTKPEPVVPRGRSFGVAERVDARGEVLKPLDRREVEALVARLKAEGVEAVAVSLLFSFLRPEHEQAIGDVLSPHFAVSLSHEVLGEFREYERASTTALDAALKPLVQAYLGNLQRAVGAPVEVMQSNGGLRPAATVQHRPVEMLLSGPAGGVAAAHHVAHLLGIPDVISLDMGGTSTDASAIVGGEVLWTKEAEVGGHPVALPVVAVDSVGAGGGSIAWRDKGGALRVGPRSAGADPGPLAYGKGGREVTVTDGDLLSGLLGDALLGGRLPLHRDLAEAGTKALARDLGLPYEEAILGIRRVVHSNMLRALGLTLARRGLDPRDFTLLAFGGAGPVHAALLAQELGVRRVVVPFLPGLFSAYGVLVSDRRFHMSTSILKGWDEAQGATVASLEALRQRAVKELRAQGVDPKDAHIVESLDLRYRGQSFDLTMPRANASPEAFHKLHQERFGYSSPGEALEVVNVRLTVTVPTDKPVPPPPEGGGPLPSHRDVLFADGWARTEVLQRPGLSVGSTARGPTIVEEESATTVVPPGWTLEVDRYGILHLGAR